MKLKQKILFLAIAIILLITPTVVHAESPTINSKAAILVEVSTGRILYEKNSTKQLYPASTTKVMTAILVLEKCNLTDMVTVNETALGNLPSGYVTCDLQVDEEISVNDLLYALMVKSANDAAYVLAEHVGGSVDAFADMMNIKAREIGCTGTHFVNPNGVHDDRHYSTAYDLYLITKYAMQNETFRKLVATTEYTLPATNKYPNADRSFTTTNQLLNPESTAYYYKYATGVKTGYTSQAGNCIISMASRDGLDFIAVVLGGGATPSGLNARFIDSKTLFNYGYDNYTLTKVKEAKTVVETIEIENGAKETKNLNVLINDSITVINNKSINMNDIIPEIKIDENLLAPIEKGQVIGSIKYKVDDIEYSSELIADHAVEEKPDYTILILIIAGLLLVVIGGRLYRKTTKKSKKRRR